MRDIKTKDGFTIFDAEPNIELQVLFKVLNFKYFDDQLPQVPLYSCSKITQPDAGRASAVTIYPGDVEDMGYAIFAIPTPQAYFAAQDVLHEMVHVQLGQEVGHKPEFWRVLREKWAIDWQWLAGLTVDFNPTFPSELEWESLIRKKTSNE